MAGRSKYRTVTDSLPLTVTARLYTRTSSTAHLTIVGWILVPASVFVESMATERLLIQQWDQMVGANARITYLLRMVHYF